MTASGVLHVLWTFIRIVAPVVGLLILLILGRLTPNRHIRRKFRLSIFLTIIHIALGAFALVYGAPQILDIANLIIGLAIVNALVVLAANPFSRDEISERFPGIVQDAIVIALFAVVGTVLMREKFLTTSAIGAAVVGFALQDTLGNMFAGLAIQIEKPFHVGHWVQIAGKHEGMVQEITWRATKIRTKDNNFVVIPNNVISKDAIVNYSEPTPPTRIILDIGVAYTASPNEVKRALLEAIYADEDILKTPASEVLLWDFGESSVVYRLRMWIDNYARDQAVRDRVRTRAYYIFRREGIEIPWPIRVNYFRSEERAPTDEERVRLWEPTLRTIGPLAPLTPAERARLVVGGRDRVYGAGEVIVRQGDPGDSMFVIRRGGARIFVDSPSGPREVATIPPGERYFGEMSLLTGDPRSATVVATSDCEVLEIGHEAFRALLLAYPQVAEEIGQVVAARRADLKGLEGGAPAAVAVQEASRTLLEKIVSFFQIP